MGNFSYMNMFSHKGLNLIASEALAEVMSMGINSAVGGLARRAGGVGGTAAREATGILDNLAEFGMFSSIRKILSIEVKKSTKLLGKIINSKGVRLVLKGLQEYSELVGEVIVEMAFDNMLTLDPNARPLGGSSTFIMAMTMSVVTMGVMSSLGSRGMKQIGDSPRLTRSRSGALRLSLMAITTGLALSQLVMRLPVYMSVMA